MSDYSVPASEHGLLRLFKLHMHPEEAKFLLDPGPAARALGVDELNPGQIEVFPVKDLEELGLYGYLTEGCGIPEDQLDRNALEAIEGWVLVVRSAAFGGQAVHLNPNPKLELIGVYSEDPVDWTGPQIAAESAMPFSASLAEPEDDGQRARRIGSALLVLLIAAVMGGVLWLLL